MQAGIFADERSALLVRLGFIGKGWPRSALVHLAVVATFGVAIPYVKGLDFFDPLILAAYACLGAVFSAPAVAHPIDSLSGRRVDARIAWCVVYGEVLALGMLAAGIATVWWTHRNSLFFLPELESLGAAIGFGFVLSLVVCTAAAGLTVTRSPAVARGVTRGIFLGLLVLFWFRGRYLLDNFGVAAAIALAFGLGFRFALRAALPRTGDARP